MDSPNFSELFEKGFLKVLHKGLNSTVTLNKWNNELVVLKLIKKSTHQKIMNELEILNSLNSKPKSQIIRLIDHFNDSGSHVFAFEAVIGGSLSNYLKEHKYANCNQAIFWISDICIACIHLYQLGIIHRDIKASNVLIESNSLHKRSKVKLCDFGCSKKLSPIDSDSLNTTYDSLPKAFTIIGTPHSMAPEMVAQLENGYSYMVDWWSIGILVFEMIAGLPFYRSSNFPSESDKNITRQHFESSNSNSLSLDMFDVDDDRISNETNVVEWDIDEIQLFQRLKQNLDYKDICSFIKDLLIINPRNRSGVLDLHRLNNYTIFTNNSIYLL